MKCYNKNKKYPETIQMIKQYLCGMSCEQIGIKYGVTKQAVSKRLSNEGFDNHVRKEIFLGIVKNKPSYLIKHNMGNKKVPRYDLEYIEALDWDRDNKSIMDELGCNYGSVSKWRRKYAPDTLRKIEKDWKGIILGMKPNTPVYFTNGNDVKRLRTAGYSQGIKIKQRKTDKGIKVTLDERSRKIS